MKTPFASLVLLVTIVASGMLVPGTAHAVNPTVNITSPVNEFEDLIAPASLTITASASDSDGTVSKVEFYQGTTLLGTDSTSPYSFAWSNIARGRYALTAKATDNTGAVTTSATVWITVNGSTLNGFLDRRYYTTSSGTSFMTYRLFLPPNYSPTVKYPVVLYLHGVGEGGTDNTQQLNNNLNGAGVFVNSANQTAYPCIMIAPQSASGWWSGNGAQIGIVNKILSKYSTDADRVYITGLSAGGMGTWASLITNPAMFAAAVPICGNGDNSKASLITKIPIWNFHSANDPTVGVSGSDSMINAIRAAGGNPIYTRYATGGHNSWSSAYSNPKTVPWMMAQKRNVAPTNSPLLRIVSPTSAATFSTTAASVNVSGTTIDSSTLVTQVNWTNNRGGSGTAAGTSNWSASNIPLQTGDNLIQVIATGTSYNSTLGGVTTFNDSLKVTYSTTGGNTPPTISSIVDQSTPEDTAKANLAFTIGDAQTAATSLTVSGTSNNTTLIPNANIVFGGSGANRTVTVTPASNQSGTATITISVSDGTASASDSFVLSVTPVNDAPTISNIADQTTAEDTAKSNIAFTVGDIETAATSLTLSGSSSNTTLVPNANIVFGGSGSSRTVSVTPSANQSGTATITVTVSDGSATRSDTFVLTVTSANDAPTISNIADRTISVNSNTGAIAFTVGDAETSASLLTMTGSSSNTVLVPNSNIVFGGTGNSRTLTVTPAANQSGTATITVTVSDGTATKSDTFVLTVNAAPVTGVIAINCGSTVDFTAADGTIYKADAFYSGGSANNFVRPIANTIDDTLYQTYRWLSPSFTYSIPVTNGQYAVTLKFADLFSSGAGQKSFDVKVEGVLVADELDTYVLAGLDTAYDFTCAANVTDGKLDLQFLAGAAGNPSINAILIKPRTNRAPSASAQQVAASEDASKNIVLTGADADGDRLLFTVATATAHGTLTGIAPNLTYKPAANYTGTDSFTFKVSDGAAVSSSATVSITVSAVNDKPTIVSAATASVSPAAVNGYLFSVSAQDVDGDALSYQWNFGDGSSGTGASTTHAYAAAGTYTATVTVSDGKGGTVSSSVTVTVTAPSPAIALKINFQSTGSTTPAGYLSDSGAVFGNRGNGYSYGWNVDIAATSRDRNASNAPDQRYDTFVHLQKPETPNAAWEIALPNGTYNVRAICGDPSYFNSIYQLNAEGVLVVSGTPSTTTRWFTGTKVVTVNDGRLTIGNAAGANNNKLCFVEITTASTVGSRELAEDQIAADELTVTKLQVKMNFSHSKRDGYSVSAKIPNLPEDFMVSGASASIDVGAAIVNFTLDKNGRARAANGKLSLKYSKKTGWMLAATLVGGTWRTEWADGGIENVTVKNLPGALPVTLTLGDRVFGGSKEIKCNITKDKTGSAK